MMEKEARTNKAGADLDKRNRNWQKINTHLAELQAVASGSPKGTYATLTDLQNAYPTGNTNIYLVAADGNWYYWSGTAWTSGGVYQSTGLANGGTTFEKLADDTKGKPFEGNNIYPKDTPILRQKKLLSTGVIEDNVVNGVSGFIELIPNQYYSLPSNFVDAGCLYDANGNYISGITFVSGTTFKAPSNAKYIRVTVNISRDTNPLYFEDYMIVFGKTYPSAYIDYGAKGYNVLVGDNQIIEKSISGKHIRDIIKNLFNKLILTTGYIDNTGVVLTSSSLSHSELISVDPNKIYTITHMASVAGGIYDSNENWIAPITLAYGTTSSFLTPTDAAFVRVNVNVSDPLNVIHKDKYMLLEDDKYPPQYVPYNLTFVPWLLDVYAPPKESKWNGKTIYSFGDSITWYDGQPFGSAHVESGTIAKGYLSYMREELGATVNNYGISGATIQNGIRSQIRSKTYTTVDAVTITGGVNDWATTSSPPPLGAIAPIGSMFDLATSYGALQDSIEFILTSNPKIKIYLITPIRGYLKPESTNPLAGQELPESYSDMMKEIGKLYGLPICDWYDLTGFNKANYSSWYGDTGILGDRYVHPTNEGYVRMSEVLIPFLRDN